MYPFSQIFWIPRFVANISEIIIIITPGLLENTWMSQHTAVLTGDGELAIYIYIYIYTYLNTKQSNLLNLVRRPVISLAPSS